MFPTVMRAVRPAASVPTGARGMATLKEISNRLKSVTNIAKITKSMKMVSAAKLTKAERALKLGRAAGAAASVLKEKAGLEVETAEKRLIIAVSSDKGLCGGIHGGIARNIKNTLAEAESGTEYKVAIVGDRVRQILSRTHGDHVIVESKGLGRGVPAFCEAALVAEEILASDYEYDTATIVYNHFKNAGQYEVKEIEMAGSTHINDSEQMSVYDEMDKDEVKSFTEFQLAQGLYYCMLEGQASEQASRVQAMENASNNASDMIDKLTLLFNRTRQAVITTELIEIISGAVSLED